MVFRLLVRLLMNDHFVNKLAESYPVKRAARWVVYLIHRAKAIKPEALNEAEAKETIRGLSSRIEEKLKQVQSNLEKKLKQ